MLWYIWREQHAAPRICHVRVSILCESRNNSSKMFPKSSGRVDKLLYILGDERPQDYNINIELNVCNYYV